MSDVLVYHNPTDTVFLIDESELPLNEIDLLTPDLPIYEIANKTLTKGINEYTVTANAELFALFSNLIEFHFDRILSARSIIQNSGVKINELNLLEWSNSLGTELDQFNTKLVELNDLIIKSVKFTSKVSTVVPDSVSMTSLLLYKDMNNG